MRLKPKFGLCPIYEYWWLITKLLDRLKFGSWWKVLFLVECDFCFNWLKIVKDFSDLKVKGFLGFSSDFCCYRFLQSYGLFSWKYHVVFLLYEEMRMFILAKKIGVSTLEFFNDLCALKYNNKSLQVLKYNLQHLRYYQLLSTTFDLKTH